VEVAPKQEAKVENMLENLSLSRQRSEEL